MMKIIRFAVMCSLVFASVVPAFAQSRDEAGNVSLGARAMYFDPKDADNADWHGGVQMRAKMGDVLAIEGSVDYRQEEFGTTDVNTWPVQATLLLYLSRAAVCPFLLGGAGWYFTTIEPENADDQTDDRFGVHAGAGLEFMLSNDWSLDGTYRYIWLENLQTQDASLQDTEFNDSGHMITIGLNYYF